MTEAQLWFVLVSSLVVVLFAIAALANRGK